MDISASNSLHHFKNEVGTRFQLYSSLFTSLPFHKIEKTGILLSLFSKNCEEGYGKQLSPNEIVENFFATHAPYETKKEKLDLLFRFIQYSERQVVLFDALEDASFKSTHDINGAGTLKHLLSEVAQNNKENALAEVLKTFCIRLVLTAHPTQFYPGSVLGIIHDLSEALSKNDAIEVNELLQQLGKTAFLKKKKPTPYDEAISLIWYLENVFYQAAGDILNSFKNQFPNAFPKKTAILKMGFWPGGDRDGNPFVTSNTTRQVADALRTAILKCYYQDVRKLKHRLTFEGVEDLLQELENQLYNDVFVPCEQPALTVQTMKDTLFTVKQRVETNHNGLFVSMVDSLINKLDIFGLHFASLDVRQDSPIHAKLFALIATTRPDILPANYEQLGEKEKINALLAIHLQEPLALEAEGVLTDPLEAARTMLEIQKVNGCEGSDRYIISHCTSALNVIEVFALYKLDAIPEEAISVDIIPLFETIDDLRNASGVMQELYCIPAYRDHLKRRGGAQTIMLGFSDGTKDGGYLMANWSIYRAKEELTKVTRHYGFDAIFFDGRGGPPARGGGKTHKFYASMGNNISNREFQLTIQGQTVSANFGVIDSARFNLEQLLNAGVTNQLFSERHPPFRSKDEELMQEFSSYGFDAYKSLRDHPQLTNYLYDVSPLRFYSETNIASRPTKRTNDGTKTNLTEVRAIPFAGSWSQLKQNVPGFFGVGSALKKMEYIGKFQDLQKLYQNSLFLKTLLDNCEMAMSKTYLPLTQYLSADAQFGDVWQMIRDEFFLTEQYLLKLSGKPFLMYDYPVEKLSISMREKIVLPLVTIQQYALNRIREEDLKNEETADLKETYGKLVMRCSFGIINAGRNSA